MERDRLVLQHYAHGALWPAIFAALRASGKDLAGLTAQDLAPVDEFHIGGRQATAALAGGLALAPGLHLLDIGCGLGGASRYFAGECGCRVTGIDLSAEYAGTAAALAQLVGLAHLVSYLQASALELPFAAGSFDAACLLHVGMNIDDKAALFAGIRRVLKAGGRLAIYDVMREDEAGALLLPLPWASDPEMDFAATLATYRRLLAGAGFAIGQARSRRDFALESLRRMRSRPPPDGALGLHIVMGAAAAAKVANLTANIERGLIAPHEIIALAV